MKSGGGGGVEEPLVGGWFTFSAEDVWRMGAFSLMDDALLGGCCWFMNNICWCGDEADDGEDE